MPFVFAQQDGEAQCVSLSSIQAVISDDSDCLLFGAPVVLRHMFSTTAYPERYSMQEITEKSGWTRQHLILFGLLLGSDYNRGQHGIGKSTAKGVIELFCHNGTLKELEEWKSGAEEGWSAVC